MARERSTMAGAGDRMPIWFQRAENAMVAAAAAVAFVDLEFAWWWLLVLFLTFDVSMAGYAHSPRLGAWTYNTVHSYLGPALAAILGVVSDARWAAFLALLWAFHIGVDRLLGYGLKFCDAFTHTHLGEIGRARAVDRPVARPPGGSRR